MTKELTEAIIHARKHQLQQKHALIELSKEVVKAYSYLPDTRSEEVRAGIGSMLQKELTYSIQATALFSESKPVIFPLKFNKMTQIIEKALTYFVSDNERAHKLLSEGLKESHIAPEDTLPALINASNEEGRKFWGTSNPTYEAAYSTYAMLYMEDKLHPEKSSSISHFSLKSPVHHVISCDISQLLPESKLIYNVNGKTGYGFVHSGYSFGGGRELYSKEYKPYDSSSFIKSYTINSNTPNYEKIGFSTEDLAYAYSALDGYKTLPAIQTWLPGPDGILPNKFKIIPSPEEIFPGDLWIMRRNCNTEKPFGNSGHAGIVSEIMGASLDPDKITILSVSREMPNMEGYGWQAVPKFSASNQAGAINKVMYLRPLDSHYLNEDYSPQSAILAADKYMAAHPEEYVSVMGAGEGEM